jgi:hypothetical protein
VIDRDSNLRPFFRRRSLLVRANGSAVDHLDVADVGGRDGVHPLWPTRMTPVGFDKSFG